MWVTSGLKVLHGSPFQTENWGLQQQASDSKTWVQNLAWPIPRYTTSAKTLIPPEHRFPVCIRIPATMYAKHSIYC